MFADDHCYWTIQCAKQKAQIIFCGHLDASVTPWLTGFDMRIGEATFRDPVSERASPPAVFLPPFTEVAPTAEPAFVPEPKVGVAAPAPADFSHIAIARPDGAPFLATATPLGVRSFQFLHAALVAPDAALACSQIPPSNPLSGPDLLTKWVAAAADHLGASPLPLRTWLVDDHAFWELVSADGARKAQVVVCGNADSPGPWIAGVDIRVGEDKFRDVAKVRVDSRGREGVGEGAAHTRARRSTRRRWRCPAPTLSSAAS